jgi:RimJ/RimL family protein N-acetyltransferase
VEQVTLRKITSTDEIHFFKWWRDNSLINLTSGNYEPISDNEIKQSAKKMTGSKTDYHFMIDLGKKTIGHISLSKQLNNNYETQIVIGEKEYLGQGYGTEAIRQLLRFAKNKGIKNVYLEVRPTNLRAIRSYEKSGFKPAGIIKYPNHPNLPETLKMEIILD